MERCDLVLKGGVVSGVVYPRAIYKLSKKYRFESIGGTSIGAIGAVLTAAAEFGRNAGGFEKIEKLTDELSETLLDKFQPTPQYRNLFRLGISFADLGAVRTGLRVPLYLPLSAFVAALPGFAIIALAAMLGDVGFAALGVFLAFTGVYIGPLINIVYQFRNALPKSDFGICPGTTQPGCNSPAITDWLADKIDCLADYRDTCEWPDGFNSGDGDSYCMPLTVGELDDKGIHVKIVTTDITTRRPYAFPMQETIHYFRKSEFLELFPARIVAHMCANSRPVEEEYIANPNGDYYYLCKPMDLPIVVLARLSFSVPFLFTAVPLYRCDRTLKTEHQNYPAKCYFSDGGISSSFPVHFFDQFLPDTPTFGITFDRLDERRATEEAMDPNGDPKARSHLPFEISSDLDLPTNKISGVLDFVGALLASAKDWQDTLQSVLTGYRERIVVVGLNEDEGGFKFNMCPSKIRRLGEYGAGAADRIIEEFRIDEHRWRRYLMEMRAFEEAVFEFARNYKSEPGDTGWNDIALRYEPEDDRNMPPDVRNRTFKRAQEIAALGAAWEKADTTVYAGAPSKLRNVAKMDG